jgi:transposase
LIAEQRRPTMGSRNVVEEIRKATRRQLNAEEKIRIVVEGLRGEIPVSARCRREGIAPTAYYRCSKAFPEAGSIERYQRS